MQLQIRLMHRSLFCTRRLGALFCALFLVDCLWAASMRDIQATESDVRAAFIHRILLYTIWPSENTAQPLQVCVLGEGALSVKSLVATQLFSGDKAVLTQYVADKQDCSVIIVGAKGEAFIDTTTSTPFVICNGCFANKSIAAVDLIRLNNRIRYNVNMSQAGRAGVRFRSDVLKWANKVEVNRD